MNQNIIPIIIWLLAYTSFSMSHQFIKEEDKVLSNQQHYKDDIHNTQYDHESFLGKEQSKEFDEFTPEESKDRLGKIFDNIDKNNDGFVCAEELREWIRYTHLPELRGKVEYHMKLIDANKDGFATWEEYSQHLYDDYTKLGYDDLTEEQYNNPEVHEQFNYADINKDGRLDMQELLYFSYPNYFEVMREAMKEKRYADRMLEFDTDKDGFISDKEFRSYRWFGDYGNDLKDKYDQNNDGRLDKQEVLDWINKDDYVGIETTHLIQEADVNKDKKLSREEMLDKYYVYVGSKTKHKDIDSLLGHSEKYKSEL